MSELWMKDGKLYHTDSQDSTDAAVITPVTHYPDAQNSKITTGLKADDGKPMLDLIPKEALWLAGEAFGYGAKKYGHHNFKGGIAYSRLTAAALRHIYQFLSGETFDKESGNHHIGHALASLSMLAYMMEYRPDLDDRHQEQK